jgi:hypothetical protein
VLTTLENDSRWLSQNGELCTSASNVGNGQLTCPPVNGEVNAANTTKTALGRVEASQDKKRRRHEAMDALADGGADAAQLRPANTPATQ